MRARGLRQSFFENLSSASANESSCWSLSVCRLDGLIAALAEFEDDPQIRVMVVCATGGAGQNDWMDHSVQEACLAISILL